MSDNTDNHGYETPARGTEDWHEPLNQNFEMLDVDVEVRDVAANRSAHEPKSGAKFLELDTGVVYVGDGTEWVPTLAMAYYDESGELVCGELADCVDAESGGTGTDAPSTFGANARSVHEGAIVFGDATQRSIWSKNANEIRSQMSIHAPTVATGDVTIGDDHVAAGGRMTAETVSASAVDTDSLDASGLSVDSDTLAVTIDAEEPQVTVEAEAIHSAVPIHAPAFETTSASAAKTGVEPVDPTQALEGVQSLEINTWEFTDGDGGRHLGPMAEDFAETFGVGNGDESIATVDADGVALAAIQGLAHRLEGRTDRLREQLAEKEARIGALEAENAAVRSRLATIEAALDVPTAADESTVPSDD